MPLFQNRRNLSLLYLIIVGVVAASWPSRALAQTTATITGTIADSSGGVVRTAAITLIQEDTKDRRDLKTQDDGTFVIPNVFPGRYTIRVEATGFKRFSKEGLNIEASQRASLGQIVLEIGSSNESITVQAQGELVQTNSPERSAVLDQTQLESLGEAGRFALGLLKTIPGIPDPGDGGALPTINGIPAAYNSMATDGVPNTELGTTGFSSTRPSIDSIQEIKVLASNFQAEYGTFAGGSIQIVTRSGTNQYHGTVYIYKQHEEFNANSFFNNRNGTAKPRSRSIKWGFSLGGPVPTPKMPSLKNKLFFFLNDEITLAPFQNVVSHNTVPTDLERAGNFSQSLNTSNQVIPVKDPTTQVQFPGNIVPASMINPIGQKLFSIFPRPNVTNRALTLGQYNYELVQTTGRNVRNQQTWRADYNVSSKIRLYLRGIHELNEEFGWLYLLTNPPINGLNHIPKNDISLNTTEILSPTLVNEFVFGFHHRTEYRSVTSDDNARGLNDFSPLAGYTRTAVGVNLPQIYPGNNPFNVIPAMSFSDVPSAMGVSWSAGGYFPPTTSELRLLGSDSLTKIQGTHTLKAGFSFLHDMRQSTGVANVGNFAFGRDTKNPMDSGYGYANMILGQFSTYTESTAVPLTRDRQTSVEWYVQDSWKIRKRLTVDYGVRFSWYTPWDEGSGNSSNFTPSLWSAAKAPVLFVPALVNKVRVGKNPLTGAIVPVTEIGAEVPGSGDPANGIVPQSTQGTPRGFLDRQGILAAPRLGMAWDVFGDGKTAFRMGGGMTYNVSSSNVETVFVNQPPTQFTPQIFYGSLNNYYQTNGVLFPGSVQGYLPAGKTPVIYSYSAGIQRSLWKGIVLDVAYVGNQSRHLPVSYNYSELAPGQRFLAASQDSTVPGSPLPDTFLTPYPGYSSVTVRDRSGTAHYNSMQTQINRRFAKGLQVGATWTWASNLVQSSTIPRYNPISLTSYNPAGVKHLAVANWTYKIPKGSRLWSNFLTKTLLDDWSYSGIATFSTGAPLVIGFSTTTGADRTGGGDGQRINVFANPYLDPGQRSFTRQFDTSVWGLPAIGDVGNAGQGILYGPSYNNFEMTMGKDMKIKEKARLRFEFSAFNVFNHTEYSGVGTTATFNPTTGAITNAAFGQVSSTRAPRTGEASLRFTF